MPATKKAPRKKGEVAGALMPIGDKIDALHALREKKRVLAAEITAIEEEYAGIEAELMAQLEEQKVDGSRGKSASANIKTAVVANVTDWDKFYAFVKKSGYFHLMQRRISEPAFRELLEQKGEKFVKTNGLEPFTKKTLNLTSIK